MVCMMRWLLLRYTRGSESREGAYFILHRLREVAVNGEQLQGAHLQGSHLQCRRLCTVGKAALTWCCVR
jgi:hypothetical protein